MDASPFIAILLLQGSIVAPSKDRKIRRRRAAARPAGAVQVDAAQRARGAGRVVVNKHLHTPTHVAGGLQTLTRPAGRAVVPARGAYGAVECPMLSLPVHER